MIRLRENRPMNLPRTTALALVCLLLTTGMIPLVQAECADRAPDGTCCFNRFNLEAANALNPPDAPKIHPPTIVDINVTTGNLLVRGPLPLMIRNGSGNDMKSSPCMNYTDWHFAYDELNTTIRNSLFKPAYFTPQQREELDQILGTFNLSDYELVVISLIDNNWPDSVYLSVEIREFGGKCSNCSANLIPGTIRGTRGYLIWSPIGFCDKGEADQTCRNLLFNGTDDYCSYYKLIGQISSLMQETSTSGKKRLIYYHCVLGTDRTGGVTIGYLLKNYPEKISYLQAVTYAQFMGNTRAPPKYSPPNQGSLDLAHAYCTAINGSCALSPSETASDESEPPFMTLANPGGEPGIPVNYIFDDYDDEAGSSALADTTIHHVHVIPSKTIVEPILRVEKSPGISEEKKLTGRIFARYYDIDLLNVPDASIDPSIIQFSIREGYLTSRDIAPEEVVMMRWVEDRWVELSTVLDHITNGRAFYSAETPGFSYFVITNRVPEPPVTPEEPVPLVVEGPAREAPLLNTPSHPTQLPVAEPRDTRALAPTPETEDPLPSGILLPAVIVIAGTGICGGYLIRRWWRRRQNPDLFRKND
jgi:PGF-pre-PGF domain-containing protein